MLFRLGLMAVLCLSLAACASRLNPLNWFGGNSEEAVEPAADAPVGTDPQFLVASVTGLRIEPLPTGAVVTATGVAQSQGYFDAQLVEIAREDGRITFEFRVMPPPAPAPVGSEAARQIVTARDLSQRDLDGIREIAVQGAGNRLVSRR